MKQIREAIEQGCVVLDVAASDITSTIHATVRRMVTTGVLPAAAADDVTAALLAREKLAPTAIGNAVAIPHAYLDKIDQQVVVVVRLARPVNLGAPDGIPTQFLFFLLGPPDSAAQHLDTLAHVARLMSDDEFRYEMRVARSGEDLLAALDRFTSRTAPAITTPRLRPDGLTYTGRFAGGLRQDIARRLPQYLSDFRDGLSSKCIGSTIFLYFACLAPAATFGGVMAVLTEGDIGAVEMIVASAFGGIAFALLGGQPLIILAGTGPLLVFTGVLYRFCAGLDIPFLPTYGWIGLWSAIMLVLLAVTDASCLMRHFTRFTDEIFAALISLIFIYEAIEALAHIFEELDVKKHHDTALLSLLLALGTFYIATSLSRFRRSYYLRPRIREFLADFGPAIALAAMTAVSIWLHEVNIDLLPAPESFQTTSGRAWTVDLWAAPTWVRLAAVVPALIVTILMYLVQNITARIVNNPDHHLQKGPAYHLDLAIVGLLMGVCSLFGLPWLVAASVRSLNHIGSLATVEDVVVPGGETRQRIIYVRENRVTGLAIHVLLGLSLLLLYWLRFIPMAVLYGLFLFMGVVSIAGNQFLERLSLWIRDPDLYPVTHYIRRVPRRTIHIFTSIQFVCLAALWIIKSTSLGILFPIFIALLVPVRLFIGRFFAPADLAALDAEEVPEEESTHWAA
ncbi:MAG: PTS sugar transporter subunit IIA [Planctomycetales bacterium]|nr:PTS sugar transporter subunit IIA [Planctomycetales bacterium]